VFNIGSLDSCVTFGNSELKEYDGTEGIYFILTGRDEDDNEVVFGTAQLNMPYFPEKEADSVTAYYVGTSTDKSLRVNDHTRTGTNTWTVTNDGGSTTMPCYYPTDESETEVPCFVIGGRNGAAIGEPLTMCLDVVNQLAAGDKVTVCGNEFTPESLSAEGPQLTQVSLNYETKKLEVKAKLGNDVNKMDIVLYSEAGQIISVKQDKDSILDLGYYNPDFKKYNILVVGLKDTEVKESHLAFFQDFKVVAHDLSTGSGILEVQWKKKDVDKYSLTRSELATGDGGSFKQTTVNCPGDNGIFCYGYFVELKTGGYDVTFKPHKSTAENPNNVIISKKAPIATKKNNIVISTINITWNLEDEAVVILCFHASEDSSFNAYDYEVIIINDEGHVKRVDMFSPEKGLILCSKGITLPSEQFKRHSVLTGVAVKRQPDGFDVMESGHVQFELS
ncbi:unnamed protein product, partial [Meganyctiphanes norvegica]